MYISNTEPIVICGQMTISGLVRERAGQKITCLAVLANQLAQHSASYWTTCLWLWSVINGFSFLCYEQFIPSPPSLFPLLRLGMSSWPGILTWYRTPLPIMWVWLDWWALPIVKFIKWNSFEAVIGRIFYFENEVACMYTVFSYVGAVEHSIESGQS